MGRKPKAVFTTGEVARICKMNVMTVNRRFDDGTLKGYKLPKSGVRRVPYKELLTFMKSFDIPLEFLNPYSPSFKLLIVDDEKAVVRTLRRHIEEFNIENCEFDVKDTSNGFDAGRLYETFAPDLLVLDIMLPDIDGRKVAKKIKAEPVCLAKILGISGVISEEEGNALLDAGFDAYLPKPLELTQFKKTVCDLLQIRVKTDAT